MGEGREEEEGLRGGRVGMKGSREGMNGWLDAGMEERARHWQMKGWMSGWLLHGIWWMETCFRWFAIIQTLKVTTKSK